MNVEELLEAGDAARKVGQWESAAVSFEQVLGRDPDSLEGAAGLGICLQKLGRTSQAMAHLAKVANRGTADPDVYAGLGNCYFAMSDMEHAARAFRRAVEFDPGSARVRVLLAHAMVKLGEATEAESILLKAIELDPNYAPAYDLLAFLLPQMGRFNDAKAYARSAAALEPNNAAYCVRFIYGGKVSEEDEVFVQRLEAIGGRSDLSQADRVRVEYGLGKAMEDLERYGESVKHYARANELAGKDMNRWGQRFDPASHTQEIGLLIRTYTKEKIQARSDSGSSSELPVLIVGMMRSGTTLTEQILSSHPEIAGAGELDYWVKTAPEIFDAGPEKLDRAADVYLKLLGKAGPGKKRVCDKMPQNYMSLGPIHLALPKARIIHCRRDPRDTCLSLFTIPFTHHPPFAYSLKNIAFAYRNYQTVMAHWRQVLPQERFLEVDYEELVANQEEVSRRMIAFLGLEWDDACLSPENNDRVVNTPSRWQVRQKVYGSSVNRWKRFEPWLSALDGWEDVKQL